jgi:hypothetical protein
MEAGAGRAAALPREGFIDIVDDSDDEYYAAFAPKEPAKKQRRTWGGSKKGKAPNLKRDREVAAERLDKDYFGEAPTYNARTSLHSVNLASSSAVTYLWDLCFRCVSKALSDAPSAL